MKTFNYMKHVFSILSILCLVTSCFPTQWYEPEFAETEDFHHLEIPAEGKMYNIPFKLVFHTTRTTIDILTYQIRARFMFDGVPGEIYDTAVSSNPINWHWQWELDKTSGIEDAIMLIDIPANESSKTRIVSVQVSVDKISNIDFEIHENDEHDWGEWITILDGIQAGKQEQSDDEW